MFPSPKKQRGETAPVPVAKTMTGRCGKSRFVRFSSFPFPYKSRKFSTVHQPGQPRNVAVGCRRFSSSVSRVALINSVQIISRVVKEKSKAKKLMKLFCS